MSLPAAPAYVPPPPPERRPTRWWLVALVVAWALVLTGLAVWSVREDPPTVPEQRDIAQALPVLSRAAGAVVQAADGPDRVIEIGEVAFDRECGLTPVRDGVEAVQDVTVRVRADEAFGVLDSIARALPEAYEPAIRRTKDDTRQVLRADAGEFVGIEADVEAAATSFAVRITTGCRATAEVAASGVGRMPPPAFEAVVRAFGGSDVVPATVTVSCLNGRTATTFTADGLKAPRELGAALREVSAGALIVQAEPHAWAYRTGEVSVVVSDGDGTARVRATAGCR